jgi:hypothetical protein
MSEPEQRLLTEREFLCELYLLHSSRETEAALDLVLYWFDRNLCAGMCHACDSILSLLDVAAFDEDLLVGMAVATLPAKTRLPSRRSFIERAYSRLAPEIGNNEARKLFSELS